MQFILQIYNRFCAFFAKPKDKSNVDKVTLFSIDIDEQYNRYISIYIPKPLDPNGIIDLSNAYASAIIDMGTSKFAQDATKILETSLNKNDPTEKLLYDNIVYSYLYKSETILSHTEPVVKPLSVFNKQ